MSFCLQHRFVSVQSTLDLAEVVVESPTSWRPSTSDFDTAREQRTTHIAGNSVDLRISLGVDATTLDQAVQLMREKFVAREVSARPI